MANQKLKPIFLLITLSLSLTQSSSSSKLRRLTQGISGYTSYLNTLIEKEVSSMANHNENLRRKLSANTLKQMDKVI